MLSLRSLSCERSKVLSNDVRECEGRRSVQICTGHRHILYDSKEKSRSIPSLPPTAIAMSEDGHHDERHHEQQHSQHARHSPNKMSFRIPTKHIVSPAHLAAFKRSKSHSDISNFIQQLNQEVVGKTLSQAGQPSQVRRGEASF